MEDHFLEKLQRLRDAFQKPMFINSGFRCEDHNRAVGGYKMSQHMAGLAVDVKTSSYTSTDLHTLLKLAYTHGFKGIGLAKTYVHIDCRHGDSKMWVY